MRVRVTWLNLRYRRSKRIEGLVMMRFWEWKLFRYLVVSLMKDVIDFWEDLTIVTCAWKLIHVITIHHGSSSILFGDVTWRHYPTLSCLTWCTVSRRYWSPFILLIWWWKSHGQHFTQKLNFLLFSCFWIVKFHTHLLHLFPLPVDILLSFIFVVLVLFETVLHFHQSSFSFLIVSW